MRFYLLFVLIPCAACTLVLAEPAPQLLVGRRSGVGYMVALLVNVRLWFAQVGGPGPVVQVRTPASSVRARGPRGWAKQHRGGHTRSMDARAVSPGRHDALLEEG